MLLLNGNVAQSNYLNVLFPIPQALSSVTSMPGSAILKKLYEQAAHNHRPILVMVTNIDGHKFKDYLIPKYDKNHLSESVEDNPEVVMVRGL